MSDSRNFHIGRGVKQGDIISPLLFNAGLEHAVRDWKACLHDEGIHIGAPANLTNIRYTDDLMLHAKTRQELVHMLERLKAVLANIGLELNAEKTRIITTAIETNIAYSTLMLTATWFKYSLILKNTCSSDENSALIFADAQLLKLPTGSTSLVASSTSSGMF